MIHFEIIPNFDHGAFTMGIDMSFMNTVLKLIKKYNIDELRNEDFESKWKYDLKLFLE